MAVTPVVRNTGLNRAELVANVATGAATTVISGSSVRLVRIVVTTAGSAGADVLFVDHATQNLMASMPGTLPLGAVRWFESRSGPGVDFGTGLDVINVASGPAFTLVYT